MRTTFVGVCSLQALTISLGQSKSLGQTNNKIRSLHASRATKRKHGIGCRFEHFLLLHGLHETFARYCVRISIRARGQHNWVRTIKRSFRYGNWFADYGKGRHRHRLAIHRASATKRQVNLNGVIRNGSNTVVTVGEYTAARLLSITKIVDFTIIIHNHYASSA